MPCLQQTSTLRKTDGRCQLAVPSPPRRDSQRCLQRRRWASRRLRCPHQHAQKTQSIFNGCWRKRQPQENRPLCQALLGGSQRGVQSNDAPNARHRTWHGGCWAKNQQRQQWVRSAPRAASLRLLQKKTKPLPHLRSSKCFHICPSPQRDTRAVGEGSRRSLGSSAGKVKEDLFATVGGTV